MTPEDNPGLPEDGLRQEIHTRHPGIADEIQGAINTLRKLQDITGASSLDAPHDPSVVATTDGTLAASTGDEDEGLPEFSLGPVTAKPRAVPVLVANESFGRYQITRQLGRGAMGAVYLAYDTQLQRYVALKTPFLGTSPLVIKRFYREAQSAANLRSPYLCPIFDVGQIGGVHYLSMAYIEGEPLSRWIAQRKLADASAVMEIVKKIARGMQKAHEQGIIHRDLKPDNIMMDKDGEPIIMDFGLARRVDDNIQVTTPGRILGTPAYMSPEQVDGNPAGIGPASDIYSLGVVFYEMLTLRLPFEGSLTSLLRQIGTKVPAKPSSLVSTLGEGSQAECVCMKMMAKAPNDRYPSMAAVVEVLEGAAPRCEATAEKQRKGNKLWAWATNLFRPKVKSPTPDAAPAIAPPVDSKSSTPSATPLDRTMPDSKESVAPAPALDQTLDFSTPNERSLPVDRTLASSSIDPQESSYGRPGPSGQPRVATPDRTLAEASPDGSSGEIDLQGTSQTIDLASVRKQ
jgi:serine/threonine protein kinase